jgi:lipopolysaccharide export system permease protein
VYHTRRRGKARVVAQAFRRRKGAPHRRMKLIDHYLLRQLLGPTLAALAALCALAILSQALGGFELIVDQRQSALVFAKMVGLATPQLVVTIMPIALLVATLVTFNRLHREQEIVVCFAGGMSRWRVIAPAMRLAAVAALITLGFSLFVHPLAQREMRDTLFAIRTDLVATMVREGEFSHPAPGLTVYVQTVEPGGRLKNLVINDKREDGTDSTFSAAEGRIGKRLGKPVLLMRQGTNQSITPEGVLNVLAFDEYLYDLSTFMASNEVLQYKVSDRYLHELVFPDLRQDWERKNRSRMLAEAHSRLASPLYAFVFVLMPLAAIIGGGFSRVGYSRRMMAWGFGAAVVRIIGFGVAAACVGSPGLNFLQYLVPLAACAYALRVLLRSSVEASSPAGPSLFGRSRGGPSLQPVFAGEPA